MNLYDHFILRQLSSPWGMPRFSDTVWMQYLLETYTDSYSYGDYLDAIEESSRAGSPTVPRQKKSPIPQYVEPDLSDLVEKLYTEFPRDMERLRVEKPSLAEQAHRTVAGLRTGYCQGIEPFYVRKETMDA